MPFTREDLRQKNRKLNNTLESESAEEVTSRRKDDRPYPLGKLSGYDTEWKAVLIVLLSTLLFSRKVEVYAYAGKNDRHNQQPYG